jgi:predicted Rossmann fold nucleotide-binding protein DprA/Smf involved in DNA uptake
MVRVLPLVAALAWGCVSSIDAARATLTTAAYATVHADQVFADAYEVFSDNARATSTTQAEKDAKMVGWDAAANKLEAVVGATYAALAAAEVALDGYEHTDEAGRWEEALACVAATLRDVAKVLEERGLKIPAALAKVLTLSEGLTCAGGVR